MHFKEKYFPTHSDLIGRDAFAPYVQQIVPDYLCQIRQVRTPSVYLRRLEAKARPLCLTQK